MPIHVAIWTFCEVLPQDVSASVDMEITDGLFHAFVMAMRQLHKDLPILSGHQNHSYSPIPYRTITHTHQSWVSVLRWTSCFLCCHKAPMKAWMVATPLTLSSSFLDSIGIDIFALCRCNMYLAVAA